MLMDVPFWIVVQIAVIASIIKLVIVAFYAFWDEEKRKGYITVIGILVLIAILGHIIGSGFWMVVLGL